MKLFPNFTSIPFDYLLISWVTNYALNRQGFDLFITSRTPSIEKFKAHRLAKVYIFLSEIMKKSCGKFLPRVDDFVYLYPQQNTPDSEFLL